VDGRGLKRRGKGDARKIRIAQRLQAESNVTLKWIVEGLQMGTRTHGPTYGKTRSREFNQTIKMNSGWCKYSVLASASLRFGESAIKRPRSHLAHFKEHESFRFLNCFQAKGVPLVAVSLFLG